MAGMFSTKSGKKPKIYGGTFIDVEQGGNLNLEGDGGGTDFTIGGNISNGTMVGAFNDHTMTFNRGPGAAGQGPAVPPGRMPDVIKTSVFQGIGPGAGKLTVQSDLTDFRVTDVANKNDKYIVNHGVNPTHQSATLKKNKIKNKTRKATGSDADENVDSEESESDTEIPDNRGGKASPMPNIPGVYGAIPGMPPSATNAYSQYSSSTFSGASSSTYSSVGKRTTTTTTTRSSYSNATIVANSPEARYAAARIKAMARNPEMLQAFLAGTGGPEAIQVESGSNLTYRNDGRTTVRLDHGNTNQVYIANTNVNRTYTENQVDEDEEEAKR